MLIFTIYNYFYISFVKFEITFLHLLIFKKQNINLKVVYKVYVQIFLLH